MYLLFIADKLSTGPDFHIRNTCNYSDDDTSCSRSAAVDGAKRKQPATSFTSDMAQAGKRRRRRKRDKTKTLEQNTNGIDKDKGKEESQSTRTLLTQPTLDERTSTCTTVLDNHLLSNSTSLHDTEDESSRDGGSFQLFVHIDGGSDGGESTHVSDHGKQETKRSQCETGTKRQALRGGSALYYDKRARKRLLKGSLCKTKHHPNTELSNRHTSITSMGAAQSNNVSKQGALYEESHDRLKGKQLWQSHTPPSVDAGQHSAEVTQCKGNKTHREGSMEKGAHGRGGTRRGSVHRRRVMSYRKGRWMTQVGQSAARLNIAQPYMCMHHAQYNM